MRTFKSVVAVIAGLAAGFLLSAAADSLLFAAGVLEPSGIKDGSPFFISMILCYRFTFNAIGCYLTAKLAPGKPVRHALILGAIGCFISIAGAVVMWDDAPHYYTIALVLAALPAAWIGGRWYTKKAPNSDRGL